MRMHNKSIFSYIGILLGIESLLFLLIQVGVGVILVIASLVVIIVISVVLLNIVIVFAFRHERNPFRWCLGFARL